MSWSSLLSTASVELPTGGSLVQTSFSSAYWALICAMVYGNAGPRSASSTHLQLVLPDVVHLRVSELPLHSLSSQSRVSV